MIFCYNVIYPKIILFNNKNMTFRAKYNEVGRKNNYFISPNNLGYEFSQNN
jgi:hypothetical protein